MQIKVKTLTGRLTNVEMEPTNTIMDLKARLQEQVGITVEQIRLVFAGRQLNDTQQLSHYSITPGSIVHMVLALRGG